MRLQSVQPTMFIGVPRVWEKVAEKVKAVGATITGVKKSISTWGKGVGLTHQQNKQLGGSGEYPWFWGAANGIVGKGVAKKLGLDCCKFGFTGAAPISKDTLEYFGSLGLNVNEVYGMSECTGAVTWSVDAAHVWGSCGYPLPGQELKILNEDGTECPPAKDLFNPTEEEQGEICYRGRNIMAGYMANKDHGKEHVDLINSKLAAAIDKDGWLHSGDKGCIDERNGQDYRSLKGNYWCWRRTLPPCQLKMKLSDYAWDQKYFDDRGQEEVQCSLRYFEGRRCK